MWKKEDTKPLGDSENLATPVSPTATPSRLPSSGQPFSAASVPVSGRAAACISQGIKIKGEVTGSEDLFVDGNVDGKLNLANGSLTIGPNGSVKADVTAREVIVRGRIEGKVTGRDKVQLWSTGQVLGEVQTERLAIEEGASLRGKVEAGKPSSKTTESKPVTAPVTSKASDSRPPVNSGTAAD